MELLDAHFVVPVIYGLMEPLPRVPGSINVRVVIGIFNDLTGAIL